jgi:hypothetical protein
VSNRFLLSLEDRLALLHRLRICRRLVETEELPNNWRTSHLRAAEDCVDECLQSSDASIDEVRVEVVPKPLFLGQDEVDAGKQQSELRVESRKVGEASKDEPEVVGLVILNAKFKYLKEFVDIISETLVDSPARLTVKRDLSSITS